MLEHTRTTAASCHAVRPAIMATPTVFRPFSQMMRREFERSLCLRIHLKPRRLYWSAPPPHIRRPPSATHLATAVHCRGSEASSEVRSYTTIPRPFEGVFERRHFSAATPNLAAIVATNPRQDEEGREMLIDITERASTVMAP